MPGELEELQRWYESQCDGDWEHTYGIRVGTLDNPGWSVEINLEETKLEHRAFTPIRDLKPEQTWIDCTVSDGMFRGRGGVPMLGRILRVFLDWSREGR